MSVKIEMDMPVGCAACLLSCWNSERRFVCTATVKDGKHREICARNYATKPKWCQLKQCND